MPSLVTASALGGPWHAVSSTVGVLVAIAMVAFGARFIASLFAPGPRSKAPLTRWQRRQSMDEGRVFEPPADALPVTQACGICGADPNVGGHACGVRVQVLREWYADFGPYRWVDGRLEPRPPWWERRTKKWPQRRWAYLDALYGGADRFRLCGIVHPSPYQAEKCGYERLRAIQIRQDAYDQTYFDRIDFAPDTGPATPRRLHPEGLPPSAWRALARLHGHRCHYCGRKPDDLEPDHRVPLIRGGPDHAANIVPACPACRASKGSLTDTEYLAQQAAAVPPAPEEVTAGEPDGMKSCPVCERTLQTTEFGRNRSRPDGLARECRSCRNAIRRATRPVTSPSDRVPSD